MLHSDRGLPMSYRNMHGYGVNTFSLIDDNKQRVWVKFHWRTSQGIKTLDRVQAALMAGQDPDMMKEDLFLAIERGDYPEWTLFIQVMKEEDGYVYPEAFDSTRVWSQQKYPLIEVGKLRLHRNVTDYFAEVEQACFSPSNIVMGIDFSPDRILQGRLLAYEDAARYRLG